MVLASAPESRLIATAGRAPGIQLWNEQLEPVSSLATNDVPGALAFSADGQRLVAGRTGNNNVLVWELGSRPRLIASLKGHSSEVSSVTFVGSTATIWSASVDGSVRIWDLSLAQQFASLRDEVLQGTDVLPLPMGEPMVPPQQLVYASGGRRLYFARGGTLRSWSPRAGRWQPDPQDAAQYSSVAASDNGAMMAAIQGDGELRVCDLGSAELRYELPLSSEAAAVAAVSNDGATVVLAPANDAGVLIRDLDSDRSVRAPLGTAVRARLRLSPNARLLLYQSSSSVEMWDVSTEAPRPGWQAAVPAERGADQDAWSMSSAFSPDGTKVAIGGSGHEIRLLDAETGELERSLLLGNSFWLRSLAFSPEGRSLVSGAFDGRVRIWSTESGDEKGLLGRHLGSVDSVAFSPTGDSVASQSTDGELRIWLTANSEEIARANLEGQLDRILELSDDGLPEQAREAFDEARLAFPGRAELYAVYGDVQVGAGNWDRAIEVYSDGIEATGDDESLVEKRGDLLFRVGRWQDAIADLSQLARTPGRAQALHLLRRGLCYDRLARRDLATEELCPGARAGSQSLPARTDPECSRARRAGAPVGIVGSQPGCFGDQRIQRRRLELHHRRAG